MAENIHRKIIKVVYFYVLYQTSASMCNFVLYFIFIFYILFHQKYNEIFLMLLVIWNK